VGRNFVNQAPCGIYTYQIQRLATDIDRMSSCIHIYAKPKPFYTDRQTNEPDLDISVEKPALRYDLRVASAKLFPV
jgi:hypothetical protein